MNNNIQQQEWYTARKLADMNLPGIPRTKRGINKFAYKSEWAHRKRKGKGGGREYNIYSLPSEALAALKQSSISEQNNYLDHEMDSITYAKEPEYNRKKADKYLKWIMHFECLNGNELKIAIAQEKANNPSSDVPSYPRLMEARKTYEREGIAGLIGNYGNRSGSTTTDQEHQDYFNSLYMSENRLSVQTCWKMTVAKFCSRSNDLSSFPAPRSFRRQLERQLSKSAIYLARYGFKKWNRKYGNYIPRDYSNLNAGQCWVSDHAQSDVFVTLQNGKTVCPWVTAWVDMKTGKVLSAFLHAEAPNSDHIFQSFYHAVLHNGLPEHIYIDNGKDYRCIDFAGRRVKHTLSVNEDKATTTMTLLGIVVIFALPYNPQAKTAERVFLKFKEEFSKLFKTYRGGNVLERPENLTQKLKSDEAVDFADFKKLFNDYAFNIYNKMPSYGKVLQGRSPDDQWNLEAPAKRVVSKEALKLFCMRTSRPVLIKRNGVRDSELDVDYWGEWMISNKGKKVYLRRDIEDFNEAWVFDAATDEYIGSALIFGSVPVLVKTPIEKKMLKDAMSAKRREIRINKELGRAAYVPSVEERVMNMKKAAMLLNPDPVTEPKQNIITLANTEMDKAFLAKKQKEKPSTIIDRLLQQDTGAKSENQGEITGEYDILSRLAVGSLPEQEEPEEPHFNLTSYLEKVSKFSGESL